MNRLQMKKIRAAKRGVYVFRENGDWGIYCEGAWLPDYLGLGKRETIQTAYAWSLQEKINLTATLS